MGTQTEGLASLFRAGESITSIEAFAYFKITSLHRRISDLKEKGWRVKDVWEYPPSGRKYKRYTAKPPKRVK